MADTDNSEDVLQVSDLTDRVDELRSDLRLDELKDLQEEIDDLEEDDPDAPAERDRLTAEMAEIVAEQDEDDKAELALIEKLLEEMKGYGGNHQWEGDWYPDALIRRTYWVEYAEQLANDIGAVNSDAGWPNNCIDWDKAAEQLEIDYSTVDYDGIEYLYRG